VLEGCGRVWGKFRGYYGKTAKIRNTKGVGPQKTAYLLHLAVYGRFSRWESLAGKALSGEHSCEAAVKAHFVTHDSNHLGLLRSRNRRRETREKPPFCLVVSRISPNNLDRGFPVSGKTVPGVREFLIGAGLSMAKVAGL